MIPFGLGTFSKKKNGRHIIAVRKFPNKTDSEGDFLFCLRRKRVIQANVIPLSIASIFPINPSLERLSKKKIVIPIITTVTINQSLELVFSLRNQGPKIITYMGAEYIRRTTFAAAVILFATT